MSLIFKALQRFGNPEATQDTAPEGATPKHNTLTWRKILLSPPIALGGAAAIFLVGLVVSQGINFLPPRVKYKTPIAQAAVPTDATAPDTDGNATALAEPVPEAVSTRPPRTDIPRQVSYQVYPPEKEKSSDINSSEGPEEVQFRYLESIDAETEEGGSPQSGASTHITTTALETQDHQMTSTTPSAQQAPVTMRSTEDHKGRMFSLVRPDTVSPVVRAQAESRAAKPSFSASAKQRQSEDSEPEHQRQAAQATMHLQVSQLANRISSAIQADDVQQASSLLAKLAKIKGDDNVFVLKLRAYSYIRQNRLKEAHALLSNVLAHNATDREAGLNMAVVDMKSGQLDSARRRLIQLQELYPEDNHIVLYLRQLPH